MKFIKHFLYDSTTNININIITNRYRLVVTNKNVTVETKSELIAAYWNCNIVLDPNIVAEFISVYNRCVDEINNATKGSRYDENKEQERLERRKHHILEIIRSSINCKRKEYVEYDPELSKRTVKICAGHLVDSYTKDNEVYDHEYSKEFSEIYGRCWNAFDRYRPKDTGKAIIAIITFLAMYNDYVDEWNNCLTIVREEIAKEKKRINKEKLHDFTSIEKTRENIKKIQRKNKINEEQRPFQEIIDKYNPSVSNITNSNKYTDLKDYKCAMPVTLDRVKSFKDTDTLYKIIAEDKYTRSSDIAELTAIMNRCKMSLNEDNFIGFVLVYNECVEKITNRKIKYQEEGSGYKFANHYSKKPSTREFRKIVSEYAARRNGEVLEEYKVNLYSFNHGMEKYCSGVLC